MSHEDNCDGAVRCMKKGINTEKSTTISEVISTFLGCAAIEAGMEWGYKAQDTQKMKGWLQESLIVSGAAATYAVLASTILRILNHKYGSTTPQDKYTKEDRGYLYLATILSQIISGAISFGVGVGLDFLIELLLTHDKLDKLERDDPSPWLFMGVPLAIVAAKTLTRFGIFQISNAIRTKCCANTNTEAEVKKFVDDSTNVGYGTQNSL